MPLIVIYSVLGKVEYFVLEIKSRSLKVRSFISFPSIAPLEV